MNKTWLQASLIAFTFTSALPALADDVTDAIDEGLKTYKEGDYTQAISQLDYASTLIRQKKAEKIVEVFPAPLSGWEAEEAESESAGSMMMGGGISANRRYFQGDDKSVTIEMMMDSPMMQSMMALFNNPSLIAMSGAKVVKIQGNMAKLEDRGDSKEIMFVVNNNALFTLKGQNVSVEELTRYGEAIDFKKLQ